MPVLVRMISPAKWTQVGDLSSGEIAADAVTGDLRTIQNRLSFWRCVTSDPLEIELVALALAAGRDRLDLIYLEVEEVRNRGLRMTATPGNTPISSLRSHHVDVDQLNLSRLGTVAHLIAMAHCARALVMLTRLEVLAIVIRAIRDNTLAVQSLSGDLITKVEAALGTSQRIDLD